jgi:hypothetical protein
MSAVSLANPATHAREAVALAVRLHGRQRGWHLAATALGVSDRTARAIEAGETSGATIAAERAFAARMAFRRQRAAQLRAELAALENETDGESLGNGSGRLGVAR